MKIELFKPKSKILQRYIECIYILKHLKNEVKTRFIAFPNTFPIVILLTNSEAKIFSNEIVIKNSGTETLHSLFQVYNIPLWINYEGEVKEVTILLKPLGLNHFINENISFYNKQLYNSFIPFEDYVKSMTSIMAIDESEDLISAMEQYWLEKLNDYQHPFLETIIESIYKNPDISISSLAHQNGLSHKTLIKHFVKYLGRKPSEFKKIVRFRKALNMKVNQREKKLTQVSYLANYFDQSHMINNFKELTGLSPKQFFKNLTSSGKNKLNWIFK